MTTFKALVVDKDDSGYRCDIREIGFDFLTPDDVLVKIEYSTLNYKDGLAITGKGPIVRKFPLIPGIDLAGVVETSGDARFAPGDRVVATGFGLGVDHHGGLAQYARVPADWLVKLSPALSSYDAMTFGTAGVTAMLSVIGIEGHGVTPERGPILVSGAGGGVGGLAIHLLSRLGYTVAAITGRPAESAYLKRLGAADILGRSEFSEPGRPLGKARWAAAIDNVGSHTLANICAGLMDDGIVMACGTAQGLDFPGSIAPFVLRGITIAGVNSVNRPMAVRNVVWRRLTELVDRELVAEMMATVPLSSVIGEAERLLRGEIRGRLIVDCR